jgi:hypothetical protein
MRPIYDHLPDCYKTDSSYQVLTPDFYSTNQLEFIQYSEQGVGTVFSLSYVGTIDTERYVYLVDTTDTQPVIKAVEYGEQLPVSYTIIPTQFQFLKQPPQSPVADWYTQFFDSLLTEKRLQVQRFFKEYLDFDYTLDPWLVEFITGDFFRGIIYSHGTDLNWSLRYFHSNELSNNQYWLYTQDDLTTPATFNKPYSRPVIHYNLTTGILTGVTSSLVASGQTSSIIESLPDVTTTVFDWVSNQTTTPVSLSSTNVLLQGVLVPPLNNLVNPWRSRGLPTNSEWLGILGSKGSNDTVHFLLNTLAYYGYSYNDLVGGLFFSNPNSLLRPLTSWRIGALIVESGSNSLVADSSVACDYDCYSRTFVRLPVSIPRTWFANALAVVEKCSVEGSLVLSYAYFASDIGSVGEPVFNPSINEDTYYYDY